MNEATWLPGIVVLAAGLLFGLSLAFRLRGQGGKKTSQETDSPDTRLKIRDLEARRDDLYRRIRAADEDKLGAEEVATLEETAAHTLRELDLLSAQLPETAGRKKPKGKATSEPTTAAAPEEAKRPTPAGEKTTRNPLLIGFAFGAAMVAVVALLVYWAVEDAQPTAPMTSAQSGMGTNQPQQGEIEIPPEVAAQIEALQGRLVEEPGDLLARKQLALTYVASGQFVEAFSQASQVLQQSPEDPDGLLVHGIVRLTMGQASQAVTLLDQVLAQIPDHRQALIYRGLALYQTGKVEQALDTWDMGLQMAGGSDPEFEELIRMAQSGSSQPAGMPPVNQPPAQPVQEPPSSTEPVALEPNPEGYSLSIDLAPGTQVPPQATLFVFLRPAAGGPPVAARRISTPRFPMVLTLGIDDSMMGSELPDTGNLVARLDGDGNVASAHAGDLETQAQASKGQVSRLTLGQ